LTPANLAFAFTGCLLGTLIGVLPGLGPAAGTAILIPLTFKLDATGTITSVLINVPGEAASVVTCLDGYQLARQGRGGAALGIAAIGSFVGGVFATLMLTVLSARPYSASTPSRRSSTRCSIPASSGSRPTADTRTFET
jgi:putative tricarboxylic transport membrane protein